jgi:hypothetical protein
LRARLHCPGERRNARHGLPHHLKRFRAEVRHLAEALIVDSPNELRKQGHDDPGGRPGLIPNRIDQHDSNTRWSDFTD